MSYRDIITTLRKQRNKKNIEGMARFGINPERCLGVRIPTLRQLAKDTGRDHALALQLWSSGLHEARILASMIAEPDKVTKKLMDDWAREFDSWDLVDQCCMNLFEKTPYAWDKAWQWSRSRAEFIKRAGFVLMARLAFSDKAASNNKIAAFFQAIHEGACDDRNFVRKAVNWALRQIGKRNRSLNRKAIAEARKLAQKDCAAAHWIASNALRELTDPKQQARLKQA